MTLPPTPPASRWAFVLLTLLLTLGFGAAYLTLGTVIDNTIVIWDRCGR